MQCLDEHTIARFYAAGADPELTRHVDAHLADCASCRELVALAAPADELPVGQTLPLARPAGAGFTLPHAEREHRAVELANEAAKRRSARRVGTTLAGRWTIDAVCGVGGMAHVYAARHRNGRRVAIKILKADLAENREIVERFLGEGYLANRVGHPAAVEVFDDGITDDGLPFLVMELLTGESLGGRLARTGPLPLGDVAHVGAELLDVMARAHDRKIVHRDLKPDNIFVTTAGGIKVVDFGIARLADGDRSRATRSGVTMGTVGYMPPEQARGQTSEIDARSDVWAIGATLLTLVSGRQVHEAETPNEALLSAMTKPVPRVRDLCPKVPMTIAAVLDRALAFEKTARFASAGEMLTAWRHACAALDSDPAAERAVARGPEKARRNRRLVLGLSLAVLFALVGAGGLVVARASAPGASISDPRTPATERIATARVEPEPEPERETKPRAEALPPASPKESTLSDEPLAIERTPAKAQTTPLRKAGRSEGSARATAPTPEPPPSRAAHHDPRDPLGPRR